MKKGKHEAANPGGGWQRGGDPFEAEAPVKKVPVRKKGPAEKTASGARAGGKKAA